MRARGAGPTSLHFTKSGRQRPGYLETDGRAGIFLTRHWQSAPRGCARALAHLSGCATTMTMAIPRGARPAPSEQKESDIWRQVRDQARQARRSRGDDLADGSRSRYLRLLAAPRPEKTDYIIRVAQKQRTVRSTSTSSDDAPLGRGDALLSSGKLIDLLEATAPSAETMRVEVGRNTGRLPRIATLSVRYREVEIPAPQRRPAGLAATVPLAAVRVRVILVREQQPPAGEDPIEWVLVTTLAVDCFADAQRCVEYYCKRWSSRASLYAKAGLLIEALQLESRESSRQCVAH